MAHGKYQKKDGKAKTKGSQKVRKDPPGVISVPGNRRKSSVTRKRNSDFTACGTIVPWAGSAQLPVPRSLPPSVLKVRQFVNTFNTSSSITGSGSFPLITAQVNALDFPVIGFEFQDLPQAGTMSALFDQYKIDEVEVIITPNSTVTDMHLSTAPNTINPQAFCVMDFDDSTALGSVSAAQQYDNVMTFNGTQGLHIRMIPAIDPALWAGGAFSGYAVEGPQWIDCNSNSVPHYGLKFVIQGLTNASTALWTWDIQAWYIVSLRNVR
jgi:hypothetical protein